MRRERVGFLERLRGYLERVERAPEGLPAIRVDLGAHRRHFAEAIERVYQEQEARFRATAAGEWDYAHAQREAQRIQEMREILPAFVEAVADQILETVAPAASQEELTRAINVAISWELGSDGATTGSRGLDEEIGRIAGLTRSGLQHSGRDAWQSPAPYAFEIRAIARQHARRHTLTRSGAVFLGLPGIDAVRWLLALEAAQSLGPKDEWRLSSELAAQLITEPAREIEAEELVNGTWRFSLATIRRLGEMRLLHYEGQDLHRGKVSFSYTVFARARPLLEEIAEQRSTPFVVLADALLRDAVAHTLDGVRPASERALRDSAAAATALQARMVVHEIRNALIPAQIAFSRLTLELGEAQSESRQRQRGRVEAGIQRALAFADEMLRVANIGVDPAAPFDVTTALRDAIASVAGDLNGSLRCTLSDGAPPVNGPRARFVLAVTNILRNAAQAVAGREGLVEISIHEQEDEISIRIDDNGPGVPPEQRRAIFEPGIALRLGGSGQGLALVRQVIEGEMHGSAICGDSPLGGARFEIVVPAKGARGSR